MSDRFGGELGREAEGICSSSGAPPGMLPISAFPFGEVCQKEEEDPMANPCVSQSALAMSFLASAMPLWAQPGSQLAWLGMVVSLKATRIPRSCLPCVMFW